ncbi:hypothetical protein F5883DRAFT_520804 [Diaporthe sp. PMI_573]|nr:hypothetical protein F5883DRAFT_520804 [Diaporthaceae sp. PMI_573]
MANKSNTREVGTGQQPATSKGNEAFEFLKLPPEIRNKIYWNVLVKKRYRCFFFQPPLTFVNKQIRSESLPVLYGNSSFIVCFDDNSFSGDPGKLSRLRKRWEILSPVSAVSPIPSFAFVTKLDIRYSFSDAATPENCVVFHIYMRNNDSDCTSSSNSRLRFNLAQSDNQDGLGRCGFGDQNLVFLRREVPCGRRVGLGGGRATKVVAINIDLMAIADQIELRLAPISEGGV